MKKIILSITTICILIFLLTGCSEDNVTDLEEEIANLKQENETLKDTTTQMEIEISNYKEKMEDRKDIEMSDKLPSEISETDVRNFLWDGKMNFFYVMAGGGIQNYETFEYEGSVYRYLGQDLNSREKLNEYLEKRFTTKVVNEIVSEFNIIEHNGNLAQPDADFGSILDWRQAKFSSIKIDGEIMVLHLNVPLDDSGIFEEETVELQYQEAFGWRINTLIH